MKEINYNTDKLIVFNYPGGAGGKFITLCLALSPLVLHQDKEMAKNKMNGSITQEQSLQFGLNLLKGKSEDHSQLGCKEFVGFNDGHTAEMQSKLANDLWRELTNQNKFYFCMVSHHGNMWRHYPNTLHIIIKNHEWVLESRKKSKPKKHFNIYKKEKLTSFDQSSIQDMSLFKKEIKKLYSFFHLEEPNWSFIEEMRVTWLKNFTKGFV
jgi:hypothetical protein